MKKLFLSLFFIGFTCLQADFFGFKKFQKHRQASLYDTVYLLYDAHVSKEADSTLQKKLGVFVKGKELQSAQEQSEKLLANLPNLQKQKKDLIAAVKQYNLSLIDEDWERNSIMEYPMGHPYKAVEFFTHLAGKQKKYNGSTFRVGVSPMTGIGEKLVGEFTAEQIIPLNKKAYHPNYFYNPDLRYTGYVRDDQADKQIDRDVLEAINTLFNEKKVLDPVVTALGFMHATAIAHELKKMGYQESRLTISDDLKARRKKIKIVDGFLDAIEENNVGKVLSVIDKEVDDSNDFNFSLIADPLDVEGVFFQEIGAHQSGIFK